MKAAIFDLDGTLLDSMGMWRNLGAEFLKSRNIKIPPDLKERVEPLTFTQAAEYFSEEFPLHMSAEEVLNEWDTCISEQYRLHLQPKPFVPEYLEQLQSCGVKMCVATLTDRRHVMPALRRLDLLKKFEFVMTVEDAGRNKRFPDIYLKSAEKLGAAVPECVVFEDTFYAAETAKKAGFPVYGVFDRTSCGYADKMHMLCDRFILSFDELLEKNHTPTFDAMGKDCHNV